MKDSKRNASFRKTGYTHGSVAYSTSVRQKQRRESDRFREIQTQYRPRKDSHPYGHMFILMMGIGIFVAITVSFVSLRSKVTNSVNEISQLQSQLHELKQSNDEAYNKANSNVDLEVIKKIAIEEYGMTYANQDQVITYSDEGGDDFVRQKHAIPEN